MSVLPWKLAMDVTLYACNAGQMWAEPVLMLTLGMMLVLPGLWLVSNVFMPLLPAVRVVRSKLLPGIASLGVLRRINRTDLSRNPRDFFDGRIVRLRGKVADDGRIAGNGGQDAVLCRQLVRNSLGGVLSEGFFAHDFDLLLETGDAVRVDAETAAGLGSLLLVDDAEDHWEGQGLTRGWFCESRLRPGDDVEIVGTLLREIDPRAAAHGFRRPPVRWVLIAGPSQPLVLRFSTNAGPARLPAVKAVAG
jgi:hypothetical protein